MLTRLLSLSTIVLIFIIVSTQVLCAQNDDTKRRYQVFGLMYGVGTSLGQSALHPTSQGSFGESKLLSQIFHFNFTLPLGNKSALQVDGLLRKEKYMNTLSYHHAVPMDSEIENTVMGVQVSYAFRWIDKKKFQLHSLCGLSLMDSNILSIVNSVKGVYALTDKWNVISMFNHHGALGAFEINHIQLTAGIGINISDKARTEGLWDF